MTQYKQWSPMLAHTIEKKRSSVVFPGYVQPKLDGMRCLLTPDGFFSRTGKKIAGVPALEKVAVQCFGDLPVDGELYSTELTFQQILSSVRRTTNIKEDLRVKYHVYDLANHEQFVHRHLKLVAAHMKILTPSIVLVPTYKVLNWQDIENRLEQFISDGYEGLMYRHPNSFYQFGKRSKFLLKYKKMKTEDVICVGYKEGKGKNAGMLGALECEGEDGSIVWVGSGFDDMERIKFWFNRWNLKDKKLTIKYQEKTDSGVSRFPVFVCWRDYE